MAKQAAELFSGFDRFALRLAQDTEPPLPGGGDEWLSVAIEARAGSRVWTDEDPCLTRGEALQLAEWMEHVAGVPRGDVPPLRFREGDLSFRLDPGSPPRIVVTCDLELAPPDLQEHAGGVDVSFPLDPDQARRFAASVRAQLTALDIGEPTRDENDALIPPRPARRA